MSRYYDDCEPGAFPYQRPLCEALQESACPLEEPEVNPLTLRLLSARQACLVLADAGHEASRGLRMLKQEALALWGTPSKPVELVLTEEPAPGPHGDAQGATAQALLLRGEQVLKRHALADRGATFPMMRAQGLLFQFFTGFCAALERLIREVESLFAFPPAGSGRHTRSARRQAFPNGLLPSPASHLLQDKEPALAAWMSGLHAGGLAPAFQYRDILDRLGYIPARAAVDNNRTEWRLWIVAPVAGEPQPLTTDGAQLCRVLLRDGLVVLNGAYHILYRHYQDHGPPPW